MRVVTVKRVIVLETFVRSSTDAHSMTPVSCQPRCTAVVRSSRFASRMPLDMAPSA
jgi:hypothetical protein